MLNLVHDVMSTRTDTKGSGKRVSLFIGLYRENAIAIESEARDPFGGNVYYVTMQITFPIRKWVSRLVLDHAIAGIQTSR